MWVLFGLFLMFSNFYQLHSQNHIRVVLAYLQWNICKDDTSMWAEMWRAESGEGLNLVNFLDQI